MEKNRRVAKAYARASIITINGSETGFDGYRIGINGLSDGATDGKIEQVKKMIGQVKDYHHLHYSHLHSHPYLLTIVPPYFAGN